MSDTVHRALCERLMNADSADEVVGILVDHGYWDNPSCWRYYGDNDNNYSAIGNQQSHPDAALMEKIVNAVDARLMNECLLRGIDLEGVEAPSSVEQAAELFFGSGRYSKRIAEGITLAATGSRQRPSFSIADCGEGQTPDMMPHTLLSLVSKSNKRRVPFVQGRFNMGGSGVLKFCGGDNLQFVLSRRNPEILGNTANPSDLQWGFTVVRRERPRGRERSSAYTYLAPLGAQCQPRKGEVLRFHADAMPIFPERQYPYGRQSSWGTMVKLYEYEASGFRTHLCLRDGLLRRIDMLLPRLPLPVRLYECRPFSGEPGSFETSVGGILRRLDDRDGDVLAGQPRSAVIMVGGESFRVSIFLFRPGKLEAYRKSEGVLFTFHGQTHAVLLSTFFKGDRVDLNYLADSLLVIVNCDQVSIGAYEDMFMSSRDRLRSTGLTKQVLERLEELLREDPDLRRLAHERRRERFESQLKKSKPLENVIESMIRKSPTLAAMFLQGQRLSNPFDSVQRQSGKEFKGKRFPTYFRFRNKDYGFVLKRDCLIDASCRILFETDAQNDYLERESERGVFKLLFLSAEPPLSVDESVLSLSNGIATLSITLPSNCQVGHEYRFAARLYDPVCTDGFENQFILRVTSSVGKGIVRRRKQKKRAPPSNRPGPGHRRPTGIAIPTPQEVTRDQWETHRFDEYTALRIEKTGDQLSSGGPFQVPAFDFFINVDNKYLLAETKEALSDPQVERERFKWGMTLLGLSLIHQHYYQRPRCDENGEPEFIDENGIEERVAAVTSAAALTLLPMIRQLGALEIERSEESEPLTVTLGKSVE